MMYLALEMILWLAAAALLGLVFGWLLRAVLRPGGHRFTEDPTLVARMTSAEAEYEAKSLAADAAVARLKADLHAASARASALEAEGGKRSADAVQALRTQLTLAEGLAAERGQALEQARNMFNTAQREWDHRGRQADARADAAEARLAALEAEQAAAEPAVIVPDRADEIEALAAERDDLKARLAAAEAAATRKATRPAKTGDDFTLIEGLGAAMEKALKAAGIETFEALAALGEDDAKALGASLRNRFAERFVQGGWAEKAQALAASRNG